MTSRHPLVPLLVLAVTVLGIAGVDVFVAAEGLRTGALADQEPPPAPGEPVDAGGREAGRHEDRVVPRSGLWLCPAGDGREGTQLRIDVARPLADDATGAASVGLRRMEAGMLQPLSVPRLEPGMAAHLEIDTPPDAATTLFARWFRAPVAVSRTWTVSGGGDLPPGTVAGPCASSTATTTWTIPGMTTTGGGEALLSVANPHTNGATVAVRFLTPDGVESPTILRNVSVPARGTVEIPVNDFLPEQPDLAATVTVLSGRVAVEGVQLRRAAIGGVDGVSLLSAATAPAEVWTVPWIVDGGNRTSWLWVANPSDRSADIELTLHTADGGVVPDGLAEVTVPPGVVRRIDLRGTLPDDASDAAVTAISNGVPVVVSGVAELTSDDSARTAFAVQLGAPALDGTWIAAGGPTGGRVQHLRVANPGSETAVVDLALWDGEAVQRPEELSGIELPAGAHVGVELTEHLVDVPSWAVTVDARSGGVVAGLVGWERSGAMHLVAGTVASSANWRALTHPLVGVANRGMTQRLGTLLGVRPRALFEPAEAGDASDTG